MQFRLFPATELPSRERAAWKELQATVDAYRSPYFHPDFTAAVAAVRNDVEVAVMNLGAEIVGFFPFQRGQRGAAKPVGGRLSDFHGVIARPGVPVDLQSLLSSCRLRSFAFDHLITAHQPFSAAGWKTEGSPFLDLREGYENYRRRKIEAGSDELKQTERKARKLEREVGPVRFEMHTNQTAAWDRLLEWKSQQYRETGKSDVFAFRWTVQLLRTIADHSSDEFGALFSALWVGERIVATHYSMRSRHVLHSWFPAYDRALSKYSPGNILLSRMAMECAAHGITRIDLGKGAEQHKLNFASASEPVAEGVAGCEGLSRWMRTAWNGTRDWVKATPWLHAAAQTPLRWVRPLRERRSFQ